MSDTALCKIVSTPIAGEASEGFDRLTNAFGHDVHARLSEAPLEAAPEALRVFVERNLVKWSSSGPWRPESGIALERAERSQGLSGMIQIALSMHTQGIAGSWQATLAKPDWFILGSEIVAINAKIE